MNKTYIGTTEYHDCFIECWEHLHEGMVGEYYRKIVNKEFRVIPKDVTDLYMDAIRYYYPKKEKIVL